MSSLNERIAALSPEKRALLERQLQAKRADSGPEKIPRRNPDQTPLPLSFAQQRLWFLEQLEPGLPFYSLPLATRLSGPLRVSRLEQSLNEIVRRHEALRTTFATVDGNPAQVIAQNYQVSLPVDDLRDVPEAAREAEAARLAMAEANTLFDLENGPLFRARLLRLTDTDHVLLLTMHHIVSDGWSMGVLYRELSALYLAFCADEPSPLAELPIQYADFALWQREWLRGEVLDGLLSYWKKKLAGMPALLELPTDRPRPPAQVFQGASYATPLPRPAVEGLKLVGQQANATLFIALLSVFKVLLFRYSNQDDVVVGSPIANRTRVEVEGLIGFFVNTLVLRTDLSGDPTFIQLLGRVREVTLEAFAHQDLPFEKLVEELQPARNLSHNPLFQMMFVLQNMETGLQTGPHPDAPQFSVGTSKFDLTLCATETSDGLVAVFEYNTNLFNHSTIVSLAQNFRTLVESAIARPEQPISRLLLLSREERRRLIEDYNRTYDGRPRASLVQEICETHARSRPDAPAISSPLEQLTYRELNARSNQLARALREMGVGPEVLVGLCVERSPEMMVGLLGILKAGGAYVPLEPTYPKDRLAYMLEDSGAQLLLTQERLVASLPPYGGKVLRLDADWQRVAKYPEDDLDTLATTDNLAYVIYTSGSTGRPKGVMVAHRGLCNVAEAQVSAFNVAPESRVLQFASLSFDASIFEVLLAMRAGATLCLAPQEAMLPGEPLVQTLRDEDINVLVIPPSVLAALPAAALPDLQTILSAGEACPAELVSRWAFGRRFFNGYGLTETSIWATVTECDDTTASPPIGAPIANTQAYLLDDSLEPVPNGLPGEIYLGGVGLARGYLGRPDLTAERYIPDPFSGEAGARLHKTGDLGRRLPNGDIHFIGRGDQQVKLRGYRIEPGEVQQSLLSHPAVRDAVVIAQAGASGEKRLAAYCVTMPGREVSASELRGFLRQRLPDFMVPSTFLMLDSLPLNENGKLDKRALAALALDSPESESQWAAPRTETEQTLARIWCEILEIERVGIYDNFFDLGGHSLLATRIMSRVNVAFGKDLPIRLLFEYPKVAEMAELIDASEGDLAAQAQTIVPVARQAVLLPDDPESPE
jgi:amino acid adenylation domain-containing protein